MWAFFSGVLASKLVTDVPDCAKVPLESIDYIVRQGSDIMCPCCFHCLSFRVALQDHPTIKFNANESVEMPFRGSLFPKGLPSEFI